MDRTGLLSRLTPALLYGALSVLVLPLTEPSAWAQESNAPKAPPAVSASEIGNRPNVEPSSARELEPNAAEAKATIDRGSLRDFLLQVNPMLWLLVACSIITMGYAMERFVALRKERVVPTEFVERFLERISSGKLDRDRAIELCKAHDSPVARVFGFVVKAWGQPALAIRQIVAYDAAGEIIELKRNVRILNAMATIGPLLGLLGTVVGIIQSFDALGGRVGPAKGEALAHGISLALVATAFGLVIALFSVAMYYLLLSRVDRLARELDAAARRVIDLVSAEASRPVHLPDRHQ